MKTIGRNICIKNHTKIRLDYHPLLCSAETTVVLTSKLDIVGLPPPYPQAIRVPEIHVVTAYFYHCHRVSYHQLDGHRLWALSMTMYPYHYVVYFSQRCEKLTDAIKHNDMNGTSELFIVHFKWYAQPATLTTHTHSWVPSCVWIFFQFFCWGASLRHGQTSVGEGEEWVRHGSTLA